MHAPPPILVTPSVFSRADDLEQPSPGLASFGSHLSSHSYCRIQTSSPYRAISVAASHQSLQWLTVAEEEEIEAEGEGEAAVTAPPAEVAAEAAHLLPRAARAVRSLPRAAAEDIAGAEAGATAAVVTEVEDGGASFGVGLLEAAAVSQVEGHLRRSMRKPRSSFRCCLSLHTLPRRLTASQPTWGPSSTRCRRSQGRRCSAAGSKVSRHRIRLERHDIGR